MLRQLRWSLACLILLLISCTPADRATDPATGDDTPRAPDPLLEQSRLIVQSFEQQLKGALLDGMADGGPVTAIGVCRDKAPQIAASLGAQYGARVGRVSERWRNPHNAPDSWQSEGLRSFPRRKDGVAAVGERFERSADGARYLRAIYTAPLCLTCHGDALSEPLRLQLQAHYPGDRATGFTAGELRGAFSVTFAGAAQAQ